jgi:hypothetical protein
LQPVVQALDRGELGDLGFPAEQDLLDQREPGVPALEVVGSSTPGNFMSSATDLVPGECRAAQTANLV